MYQEESLLSKNIIVFDFKKNIYSCFRALISSNKFEKSDDDCFKSLFIYIHTELAVTVRFFKSIPKFEVVSTISDEFVKVFVSNMLLNI